MKRLLLWCFCVLASSGVTVGSEKDKLKNGDASITIRQTEVADSGNYTCVFPRHQPRQTFLIELVVGGVLRDRSGEISGAAKPSVKTLHKTENSTLLQCKVLNARPEPTVMWQDSTGNVLPAEEPQVSKSGDHFSVFLFTTVTKNGNYRCVVTQEEISHQAEAEIDVVEESHNKLIIGLVVGGAVGLLVVGIAFYIFKVRSRRPY